MSIDRSFNNREADDRLARDASPTEGPRPRIVVSSYCWNRDPRLLRRHGKRDALSQRGRTVPRVGGALARSGFGQALAQPRGRLREARRFSRGVTRCNAGPAHDDAAPTDAAAAIQDSAGRKKVARATVRFRTELSLSCNQRAIGAG